MEQPGPEPELHGMPVSQGWLILPHHGSDPRHSQLWQDLVPSSRPVLAVFPVLGLLAAHCPHSQAACNYLLCAVDNLLTP